MNDHPSHDEVARLIKQAKGGSDDAFGELYRLYRPSILKFVRFRLSREDAAEEAVDQTFARASNGLADYQPTSRPFVAWLYGIARKVLADIGTAERRVEPRAEFADEAVESALTAYGIVLDQAISRLPEKQRQVIELTHMLGLTNEEVGAALGISPEEVNAQQWRALEALKRLMEKR